MYWEIGLSLTVCSHGATARKHEDDGRDADEHDRHERQPTPGFAPDRAPAQEHVTRLLAAEDQEDANEQGHEGRVEQAQCREEVQRNRAVVCPGSARPGRAPAPSRSTSWVGRMPQTRTAWMTANQRGSNGDRGRTRAGAPGESVSGSAVGRVVHGQRISRPAKQALGTLGRGHRRREPMCNAAQ